MSEWKLIDDNYCKYQKEIKGWLFDGDIKEGVYKVWIDKENNLLVFIENNKAYLEIPIHELIINEGLVKSLKLLIEPHIKTDFNQHKIKEKMLRYINN